MMTLELNEQERQALIELLEREISTLRDEIHHTDDYEYREFLKTREQVVKKLLAAAKTEGPLSGQVTSTAEK
jgi:hypothetical protein